jgi:nitrogen fixation protein NifB
MTGCTPDGFADHPCFDPKARHKFARVHLPVAPKCNVQCNFCNRKFDCVNESRPGVSSALLTPGQSISYLEGVVERLPNLTVVGIAGPGDPFANPDETMETLRRTHERFPELMMCVASNGLAMLPYLDELAELGVSHVTITVNAVDPKIAAKVYSWVRDGKQVLRGEAAGRLVVKRQEEVVRGLVERGITVKINTIVIPGVNDTHVDVVARHMAELGADLLNCVPLKPTAETAFGLLPEPSPQTMSLVRHQAATYLPQMTHCQRCRADAVGLLGDEIDQISIDALQSASQLPAEPGEDRPYVAVASMEGVLVNQHLGDADRLLVFGPNGSGYDLIETRSVPPKGGGVDRWKLLAGRLGDCRALVAGAVGAIPRGVLASEHMMVYEAGGVIEEALTSVYAGQAPRSAVQRKVACHGGGCGGGGEGC